MFTIHLVVVRLLTGGILYDLRSDQPYLFMKSGGDTHTNPVVAFQKIWFLKRSL